MDPLLGEIRAFGFGRIPKDWAQCNGQLIAIQDNPALFSLLGVHFGGNGTSNFALPDLRGRTIIGWSNLYPKIGLQPGTETVTLQADELPAHNHYLSGIEDEANNFLNSNDDYFAQMYTTEGGVPRSIEGYASADSSNNVMLNINSISNTGGGGSHNNMMPYQVINWCIALKGYYPTRS